MSVHWNKILLFGDSITQHSFDQSRGFSYAAALQAAYVRKLDVINRGFSGYNSEHARRILPYILKAEHQEGISEVKLATVFLGTNDAGSTFQGVPIDRYIENMTFIIESFKEKGIPVIVFGPSFHDKTLGMEYLGIDTPFSSNKVLQVYSDGLKGICSLLKVPFIELRKELLPLTGHTEEELNEEKFDTLGKVVYDGIHYSAEAYKVMFATITKAIEQNYPELVPDKLPYMFPLFHDLDTDDIDKELFKDVEIKQ